MHPFHLRPFHTNALNSLHLPVGAPNCEQTSLSPADPAHISPWTLSLPRTSRSDRGGRPSAAKLDDDVPWAVGGGDSTASDVRRYQTTDRQPRRSGRYTSPERQLWPATRWGHPRVPTNGRRRCDDRPADGPGTGTGSGTGTGTGDRDRDRDRGRGVVTGLGRAEGREAEVPIMAGITGQYQSYHTR